MRHSLRLCATGIAGALALAALGAPAIADDTRADAVVDELAISVVGDGQTTGNSAAPVAIQLVDSLGAAGDRIDIPAEPSAPGQHRFVIGADRDQAGALQQSADRSIVAIGGYDTALGGDTNSTPAPDVDPEAGVPRVIATVDADGAVDASTSLRGAFHTRHIRGVASPDGRTFFAAGHGGDADRPDRGSVVRVEAGASEPTALTNDSGQMRNGRVPVLHDGNLYLSSDRSNFDGINLVTGDLQTADAGGLTTIASPPAGRQVAHDFAFAGDSLYVAYTDGDAALVRYDLVDGAWEAADAFEGEFWGVEAREAGDGAVVYATRGSDFGNDLVAIVDSGDLAEATPETIATADPGYAFRGVAFAPGFEPSTAPVAIPLPGIEISWDQRLVGGSGDALSAVLAADANPSAYGSAADLAGEFDASRIALTAASGDTSVVADDEIELVGDAAGFRISATPSAAGMTHITVTATAPDGRASASRLTYWVSEALADPTARAHVGMADASAAQDAGDGHMFVADDDTNHIRLYGPASGEPVAEFDFAEQLTSTTGRAIDFESSARIDDTIYWFGSFGNSRSGNVRLERDVVVATTVVGRGAQATLEFAGEADGFRDALVAWDDGDGHGAGAGALQFARAVEQGWSAEGPNSLNVEGSAIAPDGTTAWVGFRSPLVPVAADASNGADVGDHDGTMALIIGIEDIADVVDGGDIVIGEHIELDLGGRAIRSMENTADGDYLIVAGSADDAGDFAVFGWTGDPHDAPVEATGALGLEGWNGSYEGVPSVESLADGTAIRVVQDAGTVDIYGNGTEAQDLRPELQKFVSQEYVLDFEGAFGSSAPPVTPETPDGAVPVLTPDGEEVTADPTVRAPVRGEGASLPATGLDAHLLGALVLAALLLTASGLTLARRRRI